MDFGTFAGEFCVTAFDPTPSGHVFAWELKGSPAIAGFLRNTGGKSSMDKIWLSSDWFWTNGWWLWAGFVDIDWHEITIVSDASGEFWPKKVFKGRVGVGPSFSGELGPTLELKEL